MHKLDKYPIENFVPGINFTNRLSAGETIVANDSSIAIFKNGRSSAPTDILSGSLSVSGTTIQQRIKNGLSADVKYQMHFRAGTSLSNVFNSVIEITMKS